MFRMSFNKEVFAAVRERRSHPGWVADPHLRKGFFCAIPVLLCGFVGLIIVMPRRMMHMTMREFGLLLSVSVLANFTWFAVAAASRARAERKDSHRP